jgi:hypothetical protein
MTRMGRYIAIRCRKASQRKRLRPWVRERWPEYAEKIRS